MPIRGLSLVGFMDEADAISYLRTFCKFADDSDVALRAEWLAAQGQRRTPGATPGQPDIRSLPTAPTRTHLRRVTRHSRYAATVKGAVASDFALVEVAPLLAFQFHVNREKVDEITTQLGTASMSDLLRLCLRDDEEGINYGHAISGTAVDGSMTITSDSLNLALHEAGIVGRSHAEKLQYVGVKMGASSPFVQVIRFAGRCYLHNGYHRAVALAQAGVSHMPCVVIDTNDYSRVTQAGAAQGFQRGRLDAADAPTIGDLGDGYPVPLRTQRRVITVSWIQQTGLEA